MAMPQGTAWNKIKPKIAPESKKLIKKHRKAYFDYIKERWRISERRKSGKKPPWTKDEILQNYHFTNVFRYYDWGTQWLVNYVESHDLSKREVFWITLCYRLPNYHAYFEKHGFPSRKRFNKKLLVRQLKEMTDNKEKWFTSAHIVLQSNFNQPRYMNYADYLEGIADNFEEIYANVKRADSMKEAHDKLVKVKGLGGFTAQEVLIDLSYFGVIPSNWPDTYAIAGPGAKEGIDLIYPQAKRKGKKGYTEAMVRLRDQQEEFLGDRVPRLTLHDIEFCLCEYSKLMKIRHGTGRARRYKPRGPNRG